MLYVVATPIGNLSDISFRAIEILKSCDYILCEDTRTSRVLLNRYDIKKKLVSYHKFNETKKLDTIIKDLENNLNIALISDAGTPSIADPGEKLIQSCIEKNIKITAIPGPCSIIQALICSGFETSKFQFCDFLPKKNQALKSTLIEMLYFDGTSICFESPKRIIKTLNIVQLLDPKRKIAICRELTKKFEENITGKPNDLIKHFSQTQPRGEIILLIEKCTKDFHWKNISIKEQLGLMQKDYNLSRIEAIKIVAKLRNANKKEISKIYL